MADNNPVKTILVTGGAGYIGSHTIVELLNENYKVTVADNYSNSSPVALDRVQQITGKSVKAYKIDLCDETALDSIFQQHSIDAVIHFAGLKSVGESVSQPILYYENNISSTLALCKTMLKHNTKQLVFSSSATVYGDPEIVPIREDAQIRATNPYGQTKLMIEQILKDISIANPDFYVSCLRYFNPVGAHSSGLIGEDPNGIPNNLLPYVAQVAVGKRKEVSVFGNDYDTPDGTGVRDYIHVHDLARGHIAALQHITDYSNWEAFNLGTGAGYSVLEAIQSFEKAARKHIPYKIVGRRPGDIGSCYADSSKANKLLNWSATKNLDEACKDSWLWQQNSPNGYSS